MYNPRKVWLLYARGVYEMLCRNAAQVEAKVREELEAVGSGLGIALAPERRQRLFDIAMAFFAEEYLEAYRRAGKGDEPDREFSAMQSCGVVEKATGYPVGRLYQRMVQEILDGRDSPEEEVVRTLIRKFGAYPAQAILEIDMQAQAMPENNLPDYCLAKAVQSVVCRTAGEASQ